MCWRHVKGNVVVSADGEVHRLVAAVERRGAHIDEFRLVLLKLHVVVLAGLCIDGTGLRDAVVGDLLERGARDRRGGGVFRRQRLVGRQLRYIENSHRLQCFCARNQGLASISSTLIDTHT